MYNYITVSVCVRSMFLKWILLTAFWFTSRSSLRAIPTGNGCSVHRTRLGLAVKIKSCWKRVVQKSDLQYWLSVYRCISAGAHYFLMHMWPLLPWHLLLPWALLLLPSLLQSYLFPYLEFGSPTTWMQAHPSSASLQPCLHPRLSAGCSLSVSSCDRNWSCLPFDCHSFLCCVTARILSLWSKYLFMVFPILCRDWMPFFPFEALHTIAPVQMLSY